MSKKEMQANQQPDTQPIEEQATPHEDNVEAQDDLQLLIKKDKNAQQRQTHGTGNHEFHGGF